MHAYKMQDAKAVHQCECHPLQRTERAALACESAAQEMEKASIELDKAAEVRRRRTRDKTASMKLVSLHVVRPRSAG
jgi:hypothetical protein